MDTTGIVTRAPSAQGYLRRVVRALICLEKQMGLFETAAEVVQGDVVLAATTDLEVDEYEAQLADYRSNAEDSVVLADEELRKELARAWLESWSRTQTRREFMPGQLGIALRPEVLPFSSSQGYLPPFLPASNKAFRIRS